MAQAWVLGTIPERAGTYFRVETDSVTTVGAVNSVAAVVFQSNWGKLNTVYDLDRTQQNNLRELFGTGDGVNAIRELFKGGVSQVKAVRVGADDGYGMGNWLYASREEVVASWKKRPVPANGELSILIGRLANVNSVVNFVVTTAKGKNLELTTDYTMLTTESADGKTYTKRTIKFTTAGLAKVTADGGKVSVYERFLPPATKLVRLWSRYVGDREFTMTLKTDPVTNMRQFLFYDGNILFDKVEFTKGGDEAKKFVDTVNAQSTKFRARYDAAGILADFAGRKNYPGKNPTANVAAYSKGLDILERHYWNTITHDRNSTTLNTLLPEYIRQVHDSGHMGIAVIAGWSTEKWNDRLNFAKAINDWRVVYLPSGWTDINGTSFNGWKAANRIAGMIASCETHQSLTHATISDALSLLEPKTHYEIVKGIQSGCLMLSLSDDDLVWIDTAITTLISPDSLHDDGWKKIRRVKCRQVLMTRINRTADKLIGKLNNSPDGRATLIAAFNSVVREMVASGDLVEGSRFEEDPRYPPSGDMAYFIGIIRDYDSLEKIFLSFSFSYGQEFD